MASVDQEPNPERDTTGGRDQVARDKGGDCEQRPSLIAALIEPPHPSAPQNPPPEKTQKWHKDRKFILECMGFLVLLLYTIFTGLMWCANYRAADAAHDTLCQIQQQTKLMHQQLVGTLAAVVVIGDNPIWDEVTHQLTIQVSNTGVVNGTLIRFDAIIQHKSLPHEIPIGVPVKVHRENEQLQKNVSLSIKQSIPWILDDTTNDASLWPGKDITTIDGSFTYDNGFGESITQKFCFLWMIPVMHGGQGSGGWGPRMGHAPCATVQEMNDQFLWVERYTKIHPPNPPRQ